MIPNECNPLVSTLLIRTTFGWFGLSLEKKFLSLMIWNLYYKIQQFFWWTWQGRFNNCKYMFLAPRIMSTNFVDLWVPTIGLWHLLGWSCFHKSNFVGVWKMTSKDLMLTMLDPRNLMGAIVKCDNHLFEWWQECHIPPQ
jgi:hypothetical protein